MRSERLVVALTVASMTPRALAQTAPAPQAPPAPQAAPAADPERVALTLGGYVEAFWQWNFNRPANGVTAWRGFDARHNTFSLSNVVLDASWQYKALQARIALQAGLTPAIAYAAEPARASVPGEVGTGAELWRYVQQAYVGLHIPGAERVLVEAGLFLTPVGPETFAARENWNWSHSNLFYALPYYHAGVRVTYATPDARHALTLHAYNGWNNVIDNNAAKSVALQYLYTPDADSTISLVYLGGIERGDDDPAGPGWRNLFDAFVRVRASRAMSAMVQLDFGFEPTRAGLQSWMAVAGYARFDLTRALRLALRADFFLESAPEARSRIFWPSDWMSSETVTFEVRPIDHVMARLEYRHDLSKDAAFYRGAAPATDPPGGAFNTRTQDTLTVGMTAWF